MGSRPTLALRRVPAGCEVEEASEIPLSLILRDGELLSLVQVHDASSVGLVASDAVPAHEILGGKRRSSMGTMAPDGPTPSLHLRTPDLETGKRRSSRLLSRSLPTVLSPFCPPGFAPGFLTMHLTTEMYPAGPSEVRARACCSDSHSSGRTPLTSLHSHLEFRSTDFARAHPALSPPPQEGYVYDPRQFNSLNEAAEEERARYHLGLPKRVSRGPKSMKKRSATASRKRAAEEWLDDSEERPKKKSAKTKKAANAARPAPPPTEAQQEALDLYEELRSTMLTLMDAPCHRSQPVDLLAGGGCLPRFILIKQILGTLERLSAFPLSKCRRRRPAREKEQRRRGLEAEGGHSAQVRRGRRCRQVRGRF